MNADPSEINAVRHVIQTFLNFQVYDVPVKELLDTALAVLITLSVGWRGLRYTHSAFSWLRTPRPKKVEVRESEAEAAPGVNCDCRDCCEQAPYPLPCTATFLECQSALVCHEPSYDPVAKVLTCLGLKVAFADGTPKAEVTSAVFGDRQVLPLLTEEERKLFKDQAVNLKLEVIARDHDRANRALAFDMRKARLEEECARESRRLERRLKSVGKPLTGEVLPDHPDDLGGDEGDAPALLSPQEVPNVVYARHAPQQTIPFDAAAKAARPGVPLAKQSRVPPVITPGRSQCK